MWNLYKNKDSVYEEEKLSCHLMTKIMNNNAQFVFFYDDDPHSKMMEGK